jgi:hypothetical protein
MSRLNFDHKLARRLVVADGGTLLTLKDAASLIAQKFAAVTEWHALGHCIELLMLAGETSRLDDIEAATSQIEIVLRARRLLRSYHLPPAGAARSCGG